MALDFIASIAWPLAITAGAIALRKELRAAFSFLESLELPGGFKAGFGKRIAEERAQVDAMTAKLVEAKAEVRATGTQKPRPKVSGSCRQVRPFR